VSRIEDWSEDELARHRSKDENEFLQIGADLIETGREEPDLLAVQ
jgi:hypothetical protein